MPTKRFFSLAALALLAVPVILLGACTGAGPVTPQQPGAPDAALLAASPWLGETTSDSVVVTWATDAPGASEVRYSQDQSYGHTATASTFARDAKYWHSATITGLTPATTYHYRIYTGGVDLTPWPDVTFRTAPPPSVTVVTFAALGDSRPRFASSSPSQGALAVAAQMAQRGFDFALHTGDIVHSGGVCSGVNSAWNQYIRVYFDVYKESTSDTPFYTALGNHELRDGPCGYQAYTDVYHLPENAPAGDKEKYYSFDWANVHVAVLDTETKYATGSAQYNWLENDLQNTSQPWVIVVFHNPAYSSGSHGSTADVQTYLTPLFESYGVAVVLNGHDHDYERTCPIRDNACTTTAAGGVVYFVTGGGGSSLRSPGDEWFTAYADKRQHFMELTVADCKLSIEARDENGVVFDSYEIDRCPAATAPQAGNDTVNKDDA